MTDDVTRRRISPVPTVGLLLIPLLTACARAPDDDGVITGPPVADLQQRPRDVEARADELLRAMSDTLSGARRISFRVSTVEGVVDDETGKTVHVMTERSVSLARPDRLYVEDHDDFSRNRFWFDSGRLTALRGSAERYAVVEVPATVDRMLDYLFEEHGLVMPVADFLVGEPYEVLSGGIETGAYLGVTTVSGDACHHLAFRQEHLDWQLWVEARDTRVVPRKFVITYTNEPGDPQFTAVFEDWDLAAEFPDGNFEVILPDGVERVSLETLTGAEP
ncbi:MAG: DUF2092 domain-containing protein [Planctomycetota bacterium]|jgi:hypothetical protein